MSDYYEHNKIIGILDKTLKAPFFFVDFCWDLKNCCYIHILVWYELDAKDMKGISKF